MITLVLGVCESTINTLCRILRNYDKYNRNGYVIRKKGRRKKLKGKR